MQKSQRKNDLELENMKVISGAYLIKRIDEYIYIAIKPLLFHWTLIIGDLQDSVGYIDRWCYQTKELAEKAFKDWDGKGEPTGWHKHPKSGRRRPDGDKSREYIDF